MKWWHKVLSSQLLEDIIDNFDPYQIERERILVIERLKHKENNKENENESLGKNRQR